MACRYDPTPEEIAQSQRDTIERFDFLTRSLCKTLAYLENMDALVGPLHIRSVLSNDPELSNWWEQHKKDDETRKRAEQALQEREQIRQQALTKLTKQERIALGIIEK